MKLDKKRTTIDSDSLLAVEGKDELHFFKALLKNLNIRNVQIESVGGKDQFQNEFASLEFVPGFKKAKDWDLFGTLKTNRQRTPMKAL